MHRFNLDIPTQAVVAGKLRRYHSMSAVGHLHPSILFPNFKDGFLVAIGVIQSFFKLILWRPDVIFAKGGYVCLPVGVAARILRIPLVIHDSDAHPGLTNRILSKWAKMIGTGAPLEYYNYPKNKAHFVGIPTDEKFHRFSNQDKQQARTKWGINQEKPLIVITGGGLGAKRINNAVLAVLDDLLRLGSVILISGAGQYDELNAITPQNDDNFQLHGFISDDMVSLLGAADIVITRAGATTVSELAALAKPTILVPNRELTGGHQVKNATVYQDKGAALVIDETLLQHEPKILVEAVQTILDNPHTTSEMVQEFTKFARPNAARDMARLITDAI